jgi:hypothetical protein
MASRLERLRYLAYAAGALLLGTAGCAFPNGATGGDPLLGSFNRPIVPTPPPERGGLGPDSPAYDAGARIGIAPPEIPVPADNTTGFMSLPTLPSPSPVSGSRPLSHPDDGFARRPAQTATGARLPAPPDGGPRLPPLPGTDMKPTDSPLQLVSHAALRDPTKVQSMEEGQALLLALGGRGLRMEQGDDGTWTCSCTAGQTLCVGRGPEPMDAVRHLLEQVEKATKP